MNNGQIIKSRFDVDLAKAAQLWDCDTNLTKSAEDLSTTRLTVPESGDLVLPTHYEPRQGITVICYDDEFKEAQEDIGRYFQVW